MVIKICLQISVERIKVALTSHSFFFTFLHISQQPLPTHPLSRGRNESSKKLNLPFKSQRLSGYLKNFKLVLISYRNK